MAKRRKGGPLNSQALRDAAAAARAGVEQRVTARAAAADREHPLAAQIAQRVYNAVVEAEQSGEAGDVSPLLWAPLAVSAELMAQVVVKANRLEGTEEMHEEVAAYFVAGFLAGGLGFDFEHFEQWRRRSADAATHDEVEPG